MKLNEWKYINKPVASTKNTSSGSFKKRFEKLLDYHIAHRSKSVYDSEIKKISDEEFHYKEYCNDDSRDYTKEVKVSIKPATEAWNLQVYLDDKKYSDLSGDGYVNLIRALNIYLNLPTVGTPDYNNLLTEWVVMKNTSYKKRFEKLIKYHIDHASSELESITKKDIRDEYFHVTEHYNNSHHEFDRDLIVSYDKASNTFFFRIFIDGKEVDSILRDSYKDFVKAAEAYMFLPDSGTREYDDLLVEWIAMKNTSSIVDDFKTYENLWD